MPAYSITGVEVLDADGFKPYRELAAAAVARYGGRFLVRAAEPVVAEGDWPSGQRVNVIEFPGMEQLTAWYHSPEYAPERDIAPEGLAAAIAVRRWSTLGDYLMADGVISTLGFSRGGPWNILSAAARAVLDARPQRVVWMGSLGSASPGTRAGTSTTSFCASPSKTALTTRHSRISSLRAPPPRSSTQLCSPAPSATLTPPRSPHSMSYPSRGISSRRGCLDAP